MSQPQPQLLSINNYHYRRGGSDTVFFEHDELFREAGWGTAMFAMRHPKNVPSPWSDYFVDEIEFGHHYGPGQKLLMAGKVIYSIEARRKLAALLDRFRPDIVHAHCIYHHISPSVLPLLKARGIPTVMTAHDLKLACPAYKMLNRRGVCERCKGGNLTHVIANRCVQDSLAVSSLIALESGLHRLTGIYRQNLDRIVTPSQFYRRKFIEWGWPDHQLTYIPNFIRTDHYSPCFAPGQYFFYFGRLAPEKGLATLIQAVIDSGVRLRLAGTGPEEERLKALAAPAGERIQFLGYRNGADLWEQVRQCRAVVLPSEWYENAPMSVLEAYACGKPVIGADIGGIPEMIEPAVTGYLFRSGDREALAECLTRMAEQPDATIVTMGEAARHYVGATYTTQRYLNEMLALYTELGAGRWGQ